jgi:putative membrane-bound dehydrogenase-like protein
MRTVFCGFVLWWISSLIVCGQSGEKGDLSVQQPLEPKEEQKTFRSLPGFQVELAACEPNVVDPVAMAFDENGRLYVVEMHGYPNRGVGTGIITSGQVKLLEDRDGDGFFESCTTFADKLRLPTSVMPWKGGALVANPPEILFLEDTDGDGRADKKSVLYTGFNLANIQQMVNGLQWGLDNWVHGCAGGDGGTIVSAEKAGLPTVTLRGRGIRFHPEIPGSLEATSGGGQFGLTCDDWGAWFTATNSQHLRQIVLPDHYLRRNPYLPVNAVTIDIPDHGAACRVHRISPFEKWRVERTTRRKGGPDARRFPVTELIPGGFITSACSPLIYRADLFPREFQGNCFVCDPANNLIHRDRLEPSGAAFIARRADEDCEFLASTDTWFRPVNLTLGPDGAMYVADFYREVIETPLSLPDDIKARLNLQSRGRGRIWRITRAESRRTAKRPVTLAKVASAEIVPFVADGNSWRRLTAQRLLVERQDKSIVPGLRKLATSASLPQARVHALWTLDGLHALADSDIIRALRDSVPGVRENGLRLAERFLEKSAPLRQEVVKLVTDVDARVRFQLAFTLGESRDPVLTSALAQLAQRTGDDRWLATAVVSSASKTAPALLEKLYGARTVSQPMLSRLAGLVGAAGEEADLVRAIGLLGRPDSDPDRAMSVLEGLGQGLQNSRRTLADLQARPTPALKEALARTRPFFVRAARQAADDGLPLAVRLKALKLLGFAPADLAMQQLAEFLSPRQPGEIQLAAVRSLSARNDTAVADILLASWTGYSPVVRREVLEALFARPARLGKLLDAIEQKKVQAGQMEPARLAQLRKHADGPIRRRAEKLLAGQGSADRRKIVQAYQAALELKADPKRGKSVFKKTCATCHRLEGEGQEVGADLLAALRNKTAETLLRDILDPSREVDPRYIEYIVTTKSGRVVTGLIAAETAASVTLRRAEKAEDTLLRSQIESIQATAKSLMPEGLEMQLGRQDVADVIAYLLSLGKR